MTMLATGKLYHIYPTDTTQKWVMGFASATDKNKQVPLPAGTIGLLVNVQDVPNKNMKIFEFVVGDRALLFMSQSTQTLYEEDLMGSLKEMMSVILVGVEKK